MSYSGGVSRWVLIRDLLIFQLKLSIDSLKDLLISPLATVMAILGVMAGGSQRGRWFYHVLRWGERFDLWLNLFGAAQRLDQHHHGLLGPQSAQDDSLVGEIERRTRPVPRSPALGPSRPRPPTSRPSLRALFTVPAPTLAPAGGRALSPAPRLAAAHPVQGIAEAHRAVYPVASSAGPPFAPTSSPPFTPTSSQAVVPLDAASPLFRDPAVERLDALTADIDQLWQELERPRTARSSGEDKVHDFEIRSTAGLLPQRTGDTRR